MAVVGGIIFVWVVYGLSVTERRTQCSSSRQTGLHWEGVRAVNNGANKRGGNNPHIVWCPGWRGAANQRSSAARSVPSLRRVLDQNNNNQVSI